MSTRGTQRTRFERSGSPLRLSVVHHDERGDYRNVAASDAGAAFLTMMGAQPGTGTPQSYEFTDFAEFRGAFEALEVTAPSGNLALGVELGARYGNQSLTVEADLDDLADLQRTAPGLPAYVDNPIEVSIDGGAFAPPWAVSPFPPFE